MSLDDLEKKVRALQRVIKAQDTGTNGVFVSYDERGKTFEGREQVLQEILSERGLNPGDLEAAGMPPRHANLWFCAGRRVSVTTTAQAEAFKNNAWIPYSGKEPPEPETNNESVDPKPQPTPGNVARAAIPAEGLEATE